MHTKYLPGCQNNKLLTSFIYIEGKKNTPPKKQVLERHCKGTGGKKKKIHSPSSISGFQVSKVDIGLLCGAL